MSKSHGKQEGRDGGGELPLLEWLRRAEEAEKRKMLQAEPAPSIPPRLMTAIQAARYLGFKSSQVLKRIPVEPILVSDDGLTRTRRYDRKALDVWLDERSGLAAPEPRSAYDPGVEAEAAELEFSAWKERRAKRGGAL